MGRVERVDPVVAAPGDRCRVRQRVELQVQEPARAQPVGGDPVARERRARERDRSGSGRVQPAMPRAAEVARALLRRGHERRADGAALLAVPLLRREEVQLVLDDRAAEVPAEVVGG